MASRKLKRKIWVLSLATTITSIGIMMYIPNLYFQILPILIPSSIISVIMPTYFLEKKETSKIEDKQSKEDNNITTEDTSKLKKEKRIEKVKDIVDEISEDKMLSLKEKKEMLQILKEEEIKNDSNKSKPKHNLKS